MSDRKKIYSCPGWLAVREDRLGFVYLPDRAEVVRRIFELAIGGVGAHVIAKLLNEDGVPPFGASPKWDRCAIDAVLRNRATVGDYQPKRFANGVKRGVAVGPAVPNYYPAIIDEGTFQAVQLARRQNRMSRPVAGRNLANIFDGLTTCAYCGNEMILRSNSDNTRSLVCSKDVDGDGCTRTAWNYSDFEANVLQFLVHPALFALLGSEKQEVLSNLVKEMEFLLDCSEYSVRYSVAKSLKEVVTTLSLANAGADPVRRATGARVRRNLSGRYYDIRLWDGPLLRGLIFDAV